MSKRTLRLHIVRRTGWRREDHAAFQENRIHLIAIIDDFMTNGGGERKKSRSLVAGGQVIEILDYLEVRRDHAVDIVKLAERGVLEIGPWHVLPADDLASDEALIRNLLMGRRGALELGASCEVGYLAEHSGHIAQLPQILNGFGITLSSALSRDMAVGNFRWRAPDGSEIRVANAFNANDDTFSGSSDPSTLAFELKSLRKALPREVGADLLVFVDSGNEEAVRLPHVDVSAEGEHLKGVSFAVETLAQALSSATANSPDQIDILGGVPSPNSQSSRIRLKQRNQEVQAWLTNYAEPLAVWQFGLSHRSDAAPRPGKINLSAIQRLTEHAWNLALQNHHPLTIGGQLSDQAYNEAIVRFDQSAQISETIVHQLLAGLAKSIDTSQSAPEHSEGAIVVYNPSGWAQTSAVDVQIPGTLNIDSVEIVDSEGFSVAAAAFLSDGENVSPASGSIRFLAANVPPFGYRTYYHRSFVSPLNGPSFEHGLSVENEFLHVQVDQSDGTLAVFDKQTGRSFAGLNHYVDGGDCGDTFNFCAPELDTLIFIGANTPIYVEKSLSEVEQTLSYLQIYRVPRQLTDQRDARLPLAAQFVPISIMTHVRIVPGVARVDIETRVSNGALDHRLRAHFPAGSGIERAFIDTPFAVINQTAISDARFPLHETQATTTQWRFTTLMGSDTGLTIASRGLPEIETIVDNGETELALTLLRCVGWLSRDDLSIRQGHAGRPIEVPDAQCQGEFRFLYSIIPHGSDLLQAWSQAQIMQSGLRAEIAGLHSGTLPLSAGLVIVDTPAFALTTVKIADDGSGIVVRGYNLIDQPIEVKFQPAFAARYARMARLDEKVYGRSMSPDSSGSFKITAGPSQIQTIIIYL